MHTQNMIIKVHLLKTWKFELSVSGLLDCFICILLSSINKIKNKKILIWQKIQLKIKQLNFLIYNFCMAHSLIAVQNNNSWLILLPTWISSLNISRGSKFQTSLKLTYLWNSKEWKEQWRHFLKKTKENEKIEKVHSTGN